MKKVKFYAYKKVWCNSTSTDFMSSMINELINSLIMIISK